MAICIAAHKYCDLPQLPGYQPLFVGAARHDDLQREEGWLYDDAAPSISAKNNTFCELTGLYFMWKHAQQTADAAPDDIVGLVHYRRFFQGERVGEILTFDEAAQLLEDADALVVQKTVLNHGPQLFSVARHYRMYHSALDLRILRNVIQDDFAEFLPAFDEVMGRGWFHARNMFICRRALFDEYCAFLFGVLGRMEHLVDPYSNRPDYQQRIFGFMGERLLDVFLEYKGARCCECATFDPVERFDDQAGHDMTLTFPPRASLRARLFKPKSQGIDFAPVFDAAFYLEQYLAVAQECGGSPKRAFEQFLMQGLGEGRQAHRHFSIDSYRNAHGELHDALGDDLIAWCMHYMQNQQGELYAYGFENFDFSVGDKTQLTCGTLGIDGQPISADDYRRAHERAAAQDIVG